jgi:hypothetical protein
LTDLLSALIGGVGGIPGGHITAAQLQTNSALISPNIIQFLADTSNRITETKPHAFVNWVLFDNQMNYVSASSGFDQVGNDQEFKKHVLTNLPITKSGYLYIYVSNETPNIDVFFDNLQVTHVRGPLLEENHYYPFGLTMSGISDRALKTSYAENKYRFNKGSELQNKEFSDGSGLEMYETPLRELDPQLGRWWQIDPVFANGVDGDDELNDEIIEGLKSQSPYASMDNNPIIDDPKGDCPPCALEVAIEAAQAGTDAATAGAAATSGSSGSTMGPGEAIVAALNPVGAWHGMVKLWNMIHPTAPSAPTATAPPKAPTAPTATAHPGTPSAPTATHPITSTTVDAHAQKKQSTGSKKKTGDNHMRQYKNNKKGNKPNPNQRDGAEGRRLKNKPID